MPDTLLKVIVCDGVKGFGFSKNFGGIVAVDELPENVRI